MPRLPVIESDEGQWGTLLNEFLRVAHNEDGTLRAKAGSPLDKVDDIREAINSGSKFVSIAPGTYEFVEELQGASGQMIIGSGVGATTLRQTGSGKALIKWENKSWFSLRDCKIEASDFHALHVVAKDQPVEHPSFEHLSISGWGTDKIGLFFDVQSSTAPIYFPHIRNVILNGGGAYPNVANRIGLQLGGVGETQVVGCSIFGGRIYNVSEGIRVTFASGPMIFGLSIDGATIGIHCQRGAQNMMAYGIRFETFESIEVYIQFDKETSDNLVWGLLANAANQQIVDNGVRNHVLGSDGSGGFIDRYKNPIMLSIAGA